MIPNVFHFVFGLRKQTEPFHLMYYLCLASCLNVNRPDAVHFHYHHEPWGEWWEQIKPRLQLRKIDPDQSIANYLYADSTLNQYRYAHLADFARLKILHQEGGIYADIDTLFLRPFPQEWRTREFILGQEKAPALAGEGGSLCNAWIAAAPGSEFARRWLGSLHEAFDGSWSNHSTLLPYKMWKQYPDTINVEPESAFYALDWTPRGIEDLFLRHTALPLKAYSLHLWNHLWFAQDRLDFSHFHAGLLSLDYVLYANTTYANNARAHLPTDVKGSSSQYLYQRVMSGLRHPLRSTRAMWKTHSIQGGRNL